MCVSFTLASLRSHTFIHFVEVSFTQKGSDSGWTSPCPTSMFEHVIIGSSIKKPTSEGQRVMFHTC